MSTALRNKNIVLDATEEGLSQWQLSIKWGLSPYTIKAILKKAKVRAGNGAPSGKSHPNNIKDGKAINQLMLQIGSRLYDHRVLKAKLDVQQMGSKLNMSVCRVRAAELGMYDWTVSELTRVATELDMSLTELLTERDLVHKAPPTTRHTRERL